MRSKKIATGTGFVKEVYYFEIIYEYNEKGLIIKYSRINTFKL
jgi:hypothetical protein